jgi:hypothetical protein
VKQMRTVGYLNPIKKLCYLANFCRTKLHLSTIHLQEKSFHPE